MALSTSSFALQHVAFEHHVTALGIGEASPRISWAFEGQPHKIQNWTQSSYGLEITRDHGSEPEIFFVNSSESSLVPWPSTPLSSGESARVRARSFGGNGFEEAQTPWSDVYQVEAGLLNEDAWEGAVFVSAEQEIYHQNRTRQPILFRKSFKLPRKVARARLYITARGLFSAEINGQRVGEEVLAPGWQSYQHRLQYSTFAVTDLLRAGENVIGVQIGEGWYAGRIGPKGKNLWGKKLELLALLVVEDKDGVRRVVRTDSSWESGYGAIQASEIYDGEVYDFRKTQKEWSSPGFKSSKDSKWVPTVETNSSLQVLAAPDGPPIRRVETVELQQVLTTPSGKTVLDFGQNFAGWLRLRVKGPKGTNITLVHVEVLENGEVATRPLRTAKQTDTVILSGGGVETWEPSFTYHGFRYVQVDGWPHKSTKLNSKSVTGIAIHSDMRETGSFESSSSPILNKLHDNIRWSMKSNFMGVPTDCPQRDERLGWTGDAHTFSTTANFLYDTSGFWRAWMKDVCSEQVNGVPPAVVPAPPTALQALLVPLTLWSDSVVSIPWDVWMSTGDAELLRSQYQCAKSWIDRGVPRIDSGLWKRDAFQYGDWLDPAAPPDDPGAATTSPVYVADAYLIYVTRLLGRVAAALEFTDDAEYYGAWASNLTVAFQEAWTHGNGTVAYETQTGLVLPLRFSLFSEPQHAEAAAKRLEDKIAANHFKIGTGFAGTHLIGHTLTEYGLSDTFYKMLFQTEMPSWLYQVGMGATTTWERWDSMLPSGSLNPGEMTSFNHYSAGSVASWIHGTVGGLEPIAPGWKRFRVRPIPGGPVRSAETTYQTPYGKISASWRMDRNHFVLDVDVPPNTVAEVILPGKDVGSNKVVGSGVYTFRSRIS
ncbi:related to alfa-L-rhamnosidase [Cephalotrichum gorgonifer]|uniref:alpha-L-rhamnosidase n=1 Tax=Cephalotrichum gorgonifer TaxID=2041049 RepID=A0AAE8SYS4_9PEZI|nr:related to alfa-L-rhamnosidase [Cephalotrichum gorgonifer]